MYEYALILCIFIYRGKTGFMVPGQDMASCLNVKSNASKGLTDMSQRMAMSFLKVRRLDVEFDGITLTVPERMLGDGE
jgi:hypothetical protein